MVSMKNTTPTDNLCEIPRWISIKVQLNNLTFEEFIEANTGEEDVIVLDVRTEAEFNTGYLDRAINLDYLSSTLADEIESLAKNKKYLIYCRTGRRSLRVCALMKNNGFKDIYNLDGGIKDLVL